MSTVDVKGVGDVLARHVMSPHVLGIVPHTPLEVALRMMVEAQVRHLPVVTDGRCTGVLHESDILWRLWSTTAATRPLSGAVARPPTPCVGLTDNVRTAARLMSETPADAVLVLDAGRVAGIVTATNLVRLLANG